MVPFVLLNDQPQPIIQVEWGLLSLAMKRLIRSCTTGAHITLASHSNICDLNKKPEIYFASLL